MHSFINTTAIYREGGRADTSPLLNGFLIFFFNVIWKPEIYIWFLSQHYIVLKGKKKKTQQQQKQKQKRTESDLNVTMATLIQGGDSRGCQGYIYIFIFIFIYYWFKVHTYSTHAHTHTPRTTTRTGFKLRILTPGPPFPHTEESSCAVGDTEETPSFPQLQGDQSHI